MELVTAKAFEKLRSFLLIEGNLQSFFENNLILPSELFRGRTDCFEFGIQSGLIKRESRLHLRPGMRVNRLMIDGQAVLVGTDFPDSLNAARIFPWIDEAETLLPRIRQRYLYQQPPRSLLDLCTGGGSIALGLAKLWARDCKLIVGTDILAQAVDRACWNRELNSLGGPSRTRVEFAQADLFECVERDACGETARWQCDDIASLLEGKFDVIVADPPFRVGPPSAGVSSGKGGEQRRCTPSA